jgi:methyltransferase (TIGR00027 family)
VLTAVARALHREEPRPWVIDDYLALGLAGREGAALRERLRAELPHPYLVAFSRWMCVRARFPEDIVEQAAADGVRQYVILGAGLDSFAYRASRSAGSAAGLRGRQPGEPAVEAAAARRARR